MLWSGDFRRTATTDGLGALADSAKAMLNRGDLGSRMFQ